MTSTENILLTSMKNPNFEERTAMANMGSRANITWAVSNTPGKSGSLS